MRSVPSLLILGCICASLQAAAPRSCAAGAPLGELRLSVQSRPGLPTLPLRGINRLGEGDRILYAPVKLKQKGGKVAVVIAPAPASPGAQISKDLPK